MTGKEKELREKSASPNSQWQLAGYRGRSAPADSFEELSQEARVQLQFCPNLSREVFTIQTGVPQASTAKFKADLPDLRGLSGTLDSVLLEVLLVPLHL